MLFRDVITDVAVGQQNRSVLAFYIKRLGRDNRGRSLMVGLAILLIGMQALVMLRPPQTITDDSQSARRSDAPPQLTGDGQLAFLNTAINLTTLDRNNQPTNAAGAQARPGDELRYTLTTRNTGQQAYQQFRFEQDLTDVFEYADLVDAGGGQLEVSSGLKLPSNQKVLTWEALDIPAQQLATRSFMVRIKQPLPTLPVGMFEPKSYDLRLESYFGSNRVDVYVAPPITKQLEALSRGLPTPPNWIVLTGLISFTLGLIVIWLRTRLMRRELAIMATTGGHPR